MVTTNVGGVEKVKQAEEGTAQVLVNLLGGLRGATRTIGSLEGKV